MQIFIDNLIFSLQKAGGISVYWSELMQRMNSTPQNITCINTKDAGNFLAKPLNWQKNTLADVALPVTLKRFLPLLKTLPEKSIFHSSYLRWSNQKNIANIVTIHDLAPEHGMIGGKGKYIRQWQQRKAIEHADGIRATADAGKNGLRQFAFGF